MDYKHLYMNVLFHMSTQKLIHSTYTPEQCVTIINRLAQEYALGKCSVMYEGEADRVEMQPQCRAIL